MNQDDIRLRAQIRHLLRGQSRTADINAEWILRILHLRVAETFPCPSWAERAVFHAAVHVGRHNIGLPSSIPEDFQL